MVDCSVCGGVGSFVRTCTVLSRHQANLYSCANCGFLFFKNPTWLEEAYSDAIANTDTGILLRNRRACAKVSAFLLMCFNDAERLRFVDYAAGYGLFVRGMRDEGFDFLWTDPFCENLFAKGFEHAGPDQPCAIVTAFEVLEHVEEPIKFIRSVLAAAGGAHTLIFTTNVFNGEPPPPDWWYYSLITGQHISFYQEKTLQYIAEAVGMRFISENGFHVLTTSPNVVRWKAKIAFSPLAGTLRKALGGRLTGKSVSDHEIMSAQSVSLRSEG